MKTKEGPFGVLGNYEEMHTMYEEGGLTSREVHVLHEDGNMTSWGLAMEMGYPR